MGVNVEEYISSSEHSRGRTPGLGGEIDEDSTQPPSNEGGGGGDGIPIVIEEPQGERERLLSPFTGEDAFTHATQDEHHGARRPSRTESIPYHYRRRHREDTTRDLDSWSSYTRGSLLESLDFLSIRDPTNSYDYSSFGGDSYKQSEIGCTTNSSFYAASQESQWDINSIFNNAPPPIEYEQ